MLQEGYYAQNTRLIPLSFVILAEYSIHWLLLITFLRMKSLLSSTDIYTKQKIDSVMTNGQNHGSLWL